MKRLPLWQILVERGLFPDRDTATRWLMAGAVLVNEQRMDKAGSLAPVDADIRIKGYEARYVGRGGVKLAGAIADLGVRVQDRVTLDTGASTGGFTDCLLQHGASKVYAIDVGYGQLAGKLRANPRVVNMERTNISAVSPEALQPSPSLATVDLSYLSLKTAIPVVAKLVTPRSDLLCLVKPLFEIADKQARRTGRIPDDTYADMLHDLVEYVQLQGLSVAGVVASRIAGNNGTREFFLHVQTTPAAHVRAIASDIAAAVSAQPGYDKEA